MRNDFERKYGGNKTIIPVLYNILGYQTALLCFIYLLYYSSFLHNSEDWTDA